MDRTALPLPGLPPPFGDGSLRQPVLNSDYYNLDVNVNIFVSGSVGEGIIAANVGRRKCNLSISLSPHLQGLEHDRPVGNPIFGTKMRFAENSA
jgi:hypothetical protein